jgi:lipid-A-disaccharide synthase
VVEGEQEKYAAFEASDVALAASGTVSLELALAGVPMVIAYRVGWLTGAIASRLMTVRYITLVNLILDREAVPEFVQDRCRADLLAPAVERLLSDETVRTAQREALNEAVQRLRVEGETPSARAAATVLTLAQQGRSGPQRA